MVEKIKNIVELRNKNLDYILENTGNIDDHIIYAAKFIKDNNIWVIDNICYYQNKDTNFLWVKLNDAGDKFIDKLSSLCQEFYLSLKNFERNIILKEVASLLLNKCVCPIFDFSQNFLFFKNGIFDIFTNNFIEVEFKKLNEIPLDFLDFEFEENISYDKTFLKLLNWWTRDDNDNLIFLKQMLGAIFAGYQVEKIFNFYGVEGSGKSLLVSLIEVVVGEEYIANTNITSLTQRFGTLQILRKRLLLESDIQDVEEIEPSMLKKITGGDTVQFEFKGGGFLYQKPRLNVLISSNNLLQFKGTFEGINRRLIVYKFPYSILNFQKNGRFEPLELKELNTLRNFDNGRWRFKKEIIKPFLIDCLKEFHNLYLNDFKFLETKEMKDEKRNSEIKTNNVYFYYIDKFNIEELFIKDIDLFVLKAKSQAIFDDYKLWTFNNGYRTLGKNNFLHRLRDVIIKETKKNCWVNRNVKNEKLFVIEMDLIDKIDLNINLEDL